MCIATYYLTGSYHRYKVVMYWYVECAIPISFL